MGYGPAAGFTLAATVKWVIFTLTRMARDKAWGEITITVQDGRILFCHDHRSYRDRLPGAGPETDALVKQLVTSEGNS